MIYYRKYFSHSKWHTKKGSPIKDNIRGEITIETCSQICEGFTDKNNHLISEFNQRTTWPPYLNCTGL